jgi:fluoride exporter
VTALLVALGAAVGAPLRFFAGHHLDDDFPAGTLLVNVAGSFLLGLFSALSLNGHQMAFLGTGFCGAFTTWSALAVKAAERGWRGGTTYALVSVVGAVAACALGFLVAQS